MKMKAEIQTKPRLEFPVDPKPGEKTSFTFLDDESELGQYFLKRDIELCKEYDRGPIDDESL